MPDSNPDLYWKARIPLMLSALLLLVAAIAQWWLNATNPTRASVFTCIMLFCVALAFFFLAGTVETWCAPAQAQHGSLTWGEHSWHEPTLRDCLSVHK